MRIRNFFKKNITNLSNPELLKGSVHSYNRFWGHENFVKAIKNAGGGKNVNLTRS